MAFLKGQESWWVQVSSLLWSSPYEGAVSTLISQVCRALL